MQGAKQNREAKKCLTVILYGSGKASLRLLGVCPATIMNQIEVYGKTIAELEVSSYLRRQENKQARKR